jgi:hypothetical protein
MIARMRRRCSLVTASKAGAPKDADADGELTTEWGEVRSNFGATSEQQRPNSR